MIIDAIWRKLHCTLTASGDCSLWRSKRQPWKLWENPEIDWLNYTKLPFLGYTVVYHIFGRTQLLRTDGFRCTARYVLSVSIQQALIEILEDCDTRTTATGAYQSKGIKTFDIKSSGAQRHNIFALVQHRTSGQLFAFAGESPARFRSGPKALSEPGRDGRDVQRQHLWGRRENSTQTYHSCLVHSFKIVNTFDSL